MGVWLPPPYFPFSVEILFSRSPGGAQAAPPPEPFPCPLFCSPFLCLFSTPRLFLPTNRCSLITLISISPLHVILCFRPPPFIFPPSCLGLSLLSLFFCSLVGSVLGPPETSFLFSTQLLKSFFLFEHFAYPFFGECVSIGFLALLPLFGFQSFFSLVS